LFFRHWGAFDDPARLRIVRINNMFHSAHWQETLGRLACCRFQQRHHLHHCYQHCTDWLHPSQCILHCTLCLQHQDVATDKYTLRPTAIRL